MIADEIRDDADALSADTDEAEIKRVVMDLLDSAARKIGCKYRAGIDYSVHITDARGYRGRAKGGRLSGPDWLRFSRRIFDGTTARWLVTVLHELAHLTALGDSHGARWQENYRGLLSRCGLSVEFGRTPGYESLVTDSSGEAIVDRRWRYRSGRGPAMDGFEVEQVDAGNYLVMAPDGVKYRIVRTYKDAWSVYYERDLDAVTSAAPWYGGKSKTVWDVHGDSSPEWMDRRLKDCKTWVKRDTREEKNPSRPDPRVTKVAAEDGDAKPVAWEKPSNHGWSKLHLTEDGETTLCGVDIRSPNTEATPAGECGHCFS